MINENTTNGTDDTTADLPPAPNGHGASNGPANGEPPQADTVKEGAAKDAASSSKKKKKGHRRDEEAASAAVASAAVAPTDPQAVQPAPAATIEPIATTEPTEPPSPVDAPAAPPIEESATAPIEAPVESLRLRMKIWTDPRTSKRYLMLTAFMRDIVNGQPVSDVMYAYAMRDDDTKLVTLTAAEWNSLPFFYFQEDGPAPRATSRPIDVVTSRGRPA